MPSYTLYIRPEKADKRGRAPIYFKVVHAGERAACAIGLRVRPADWHPERERLRPRGDEAADMNATLGRVVGAAEAEEARLLGAGETVTAARLRDAAAAVVRPAAAERAPAEAEPTAATDFLLYARAYVEGCRRRGQQRYYKRSNAVVNKLEASLRRHLRVPEGRPVRLPFDAFTTQLARAWHTDLLAPEAEGGFGNAVNTATGNVSVIRTIIRAAIREELMGRDPTQVLVLREQPTVKRRLTPEGVQKLAGLNLPQGSLLAAARDAFLFAVYLGGVRFGDLAERRVSEVHEVEGRLRLEYRMHKSRKLMSFVLVPSAERIFRAWKDRPRPAPRDGGPDDYIFPFLDRRSVATPAKWAASISSANTVVNRKLKDLAALAEMKGPDGGPFRLTTHMTRHSFAEMARKAGWSAIDIQHALGHSHFATTQRYLADLDRGRLDENMDRLFGGDE